MPRVQAALGDSFDLEAAPRLLRINQPRARSWDVPFVLSRRQVGWTECVFSDAGALGFRKVQEMVELPCSCKPCECETNRPALPKVVSDDDFLDLEARWRTVMSITPIVLQRLVAKKITGAYLSCAPGGSPWSSLLGRSRGFVVVGACSLSLHTVAVRANDTSGGASTVIKYSK